jgi:hypothetical protein
VLVVEQIRTGRPVLRNFRPEDRDAVQALAADPAVVR